MRTGKSWNFRFKKEQRRSGCELWILPWQVLTISQSAANLWKGLVIGRRRDRLWFYFARGIVDRTSEETECKSIMSERSKVIIIGGGFGGLSAAEALKSAPVDVTLIDRRNYHLFQPLLYQVATGSLAPGEIAAPIRGVLGRQKNARVLLGDVQDIDPVAKRVVLADGATFDYDTLIVAVGSQSSYFGHDNWREWAPSLKSVEEATNVRHKILYAFEAAE